MKKKVNKNITNTVKKKKRKINAVNLWALIISLIACLGLIVFAIGLVFLTSMLRDKPTLAISDFTNSESSIIYDADGNQIAELGVTIRENVSYDDMPNCLIDAFVAVEDSRYFEHNGFDVPRFAKAFLSNLRTMSFSQGGSTFTMQLVKNTYFSNDETGQQASRSGIGGVKRKVQEIALAMELEASKQVNKKTILELYLNKLNFGGSRNIRGVQKAAEYYFGKDVSELNLSESALLAGVINAPNAYNPFVSLQKATTRRNEVLYQMKYHGYITDDEYLLARSIKVEDLLVDEDARNKSSNGIAVPYQAYIDQVVSETYELTGKDPYTTGMRIYTYMNKEVQSVMDSIENGTYEGIEFPDDEFELASIVVNNSTGAIVGILGGRNYADGGSLLLNHATEQYKQPGSSIKPILDYSLAFENLGWATSHVLVDKPIVYPGTNVIIANSNGKYAGQVTLKEALGNSLNTPAIQTLQAVIDAKGTSYVVDYLNSMGINIKKEDFDVQCGIGGNKLQVSCLQMAGAQGALINGGKYTTPHTVSRIEFLDGKAPITPAYTSTQTISSEAAYMISTLLESNVSGGFANLMQVLIDSYPVYAKTGTTDWADAGVAYGIPVGAIKDAWMIGSTTEYTVATWIGYERAQKDKQSYITLNAYLGNIQGKTTNAILDETVSEYGRPKGLVKPDGVVSISHILATYPYASPVAGMDEKYITSGYIKKEYASLVNPEDAKVVSPMIGDPTISYENNTLTINWPEYPNPTDLQIASEEMDISLYRSDGSIITEWKGRRLFDYSWVYGPIKYKAEIKINNTVVSSVTSSEKSATYNLDTNPGDKVTACAYYAYENASNSSTQRCVDLDIENQLITITFPKTTAEDNVTYLTSLGIKCQIIEATATNEHPAGSFTISDGTKTYSPGSTIDMYESDIQVASFVITKYTDAPDSLTLTKNNSNELRGNEKRIDECVITATYTGSSTGTFSWIYDENKAAELNIKIEKSGNIAKVITTGVTNPGTLKITVQYAGLSAFTTITVATGVEN